MIVCQSDKDNEAINGISQKLRVMFESLQATGIELDFTTENATHWVLAETGSELSVIGAGASVKAASKKGRGGTIKRLHVTELAFFEYAQITMNALLECVPRTGESEIVIESTANGAAGLFYDYYQDAKSSRTSYRPSFFRWLDQPEYALPLERGEHIEPSTPREVEMCRKYGATDEQIKWFRSKVAEKNGSQDLVDQEYPLDEETCWITAGKPFLDPERTKQLLSESIPPIRTDRFSSSVPDPAARNELLVWEEPHLRDEYVVIGDPSEGVVGGDPCAAAVYHRSSGRHVASVHGIWRTHEFATVLERVGLLYHTALLVVERANHGHAVLNALLRLGVRSPGQPQADPYPRVYFGEDEKAGWLSGQVPRATAMEAFAAAHRKGEWRSPDRDVLNEMQRFVVNAKGKPEAAPGAHDDRVIVHVIGWSVLTRATSYRATIVEGGDGGTRYVHAEGARSFW